MKPGDKIRKVRKLEEIAAVLEVLAEILNGRVQYESIDIQKMVERVVEENGEIMRVLEQA